MPQKTRNELKEIFKTGAKPSGDDFKAFIDSTLNVSDDGIAKASGADTPLKINAQGTDEKLLDFYTGETKTWSINQKPADDKSGLNIATPGGSKLFIESSTGDVGIGTTSPGAKLEINGNLKLQSGVAVNEFSTDGNLSGNSDLAIPTEKAVKTYLQAYVETVVVTGMIVMWSGSGNAIPAGWALCDGGGNPARPDLRDRFIMGASASNNKTSGNANSHSHSVKLTDRSVTVNSGGTHSHNVPASLGLYKRGGSSGGAGVLDAAGNAGSRTGVKIADDAGSHYHTAKVSFDINSGTVYEIKPKWYALCFIIKL